MRLADESRRVSRVVELYLDGLKAFRRSDDKIDVVFCVIPDIVYTNCRPLSRVRDAIGQRPTLAQRRAREGGQLGPLGRRRDTETSTSTPRTFVVGLKARAMEYDLPIQNSARVDASSPTTRRHLGQRGLDSRSAIASWNIGTAFVLQEPAASPGAWMALAKACAT